MRACPRRIFAVAEVLEPPTVSGHQGWFSAARLGESTWRGRTLCIIPAVTGPCTRRDRSIDLPGAGPWHGGGPFRHGFHPARQGHGALRTERLPDARVCPFASPLGAVVVAGRVSADRRAGAGRVCARAIWVAGFRRGLGWSSAGGADHRAVPCFPRRRARASARRRALPGPSRFFFAVTNAPLTLPEDAKLRPRVCGFPLRGRRREEPRFRRDNLRAAPRGTAACGPILFQQPAQDRADPGSARACRPEPRARNDPGGHVELVESWGRGLGRPAEIGGTGVYPCRHGGSRASTARDRAGTQARNEIRLGGPGTWRCRLPSPFRGDDQPVGLPRASRSRPARPARPGPRQLVPRGRQHVVAVGDRGAEFEVSGPRQEDRIIFEAAGQPRGNSMLPSCRAEVGRDNRSVSLSVRPEGLFLAGEVFPAAGGGASGRKTASSLLYSRHRPTGPVPRPGQPPGRSQPP